MGSSQGELKMVKVDGFRLDTLQLGDQLEICLNNRPAFSVIISDPQEGQAIVTPSPPGRFGAGFRDAKTTLGSRPFQEGCKSHLLKEEDPEIKWAELMFGYELVLRHEDDFFGKEVRILYTGESITAVTRLQVGQVAI